jgi:hypothetical protein
MSETTFVKGLADFLSLSGDRDYYKDYEPEVWNILLGQKDIEPEFAKVIDEHFWELVNPHDGVLTYTRGGESKKESKTTKVEAEGEDTRATEVIEAEAWAKLISKAVSRAAKLKADQAAEWLA